MNDKKSSTCDGCYWNGLCDCSLPCEYYDALGGEDDDSSILAYIEKERREYYKEWCEYIRDFE